jgi:Tol biopolymer transport system component/regulation of enolase protein 1 (concanavalin A-like superfamily)
MTPNSRHFLAIVVLFMSAKLASAASTELGIFSHQSDIGNVAKAGTVNFDPAKGEYLIAGGGENMWFTNDAFHFVWKQMSGDFMLTADVKFIGTGGNPHRKACLLVRQSLEPGSVYADVAFHGSGLTALQYRDTPAGTTHEIQSNISTPVRMRIEKRGDYISMWLAAAGEDLKPAGGYLRIPFKGEFYVGLGVCAHDNKAMEKAVFSNVELTPVSTPANAQPVLESTLETVAVASSDRSVVYRARVHFEAPNWSRDGKFFLFNGNGRIYKLPVTGGTPELLDTGGQIHCNNDHGLSPDGTQLAISDQTKDGKSRIYILPVSGGTPRLVTPPAPSYWHGWSPDGKTLAYCAERNGQFDIYTMPVAGGEETRLTTAPGSHDGPDYSPEGEYIYFNSDRTGRMQIWRMMLDGSEQEQITSDDYCNWFAHPSPNGRWMVFLSYAKDVKGHPANKDVMIRLMSLPDKKIQVLTKLFGGQGTINVPSWSPDSRKVAFVSYQLVYP